MPAKIGTPASPSPTGDAQQRPLIPETACGSWDHRTGLSSILNQADDPEMIDHDFDRNAVIQEMDDARATLHDLLAAADGEDLRRRSNGTRWTNEELLFHMVFGYMIVRALLILVRIFGRLPATASRGFAAMLNFVTAPFHVVNYWGSRFAAVTFNHRRMGTQFDRVVGSLERHLRRESPESLTRSMSFPTRWDPFFKPTMTLAEVYHYPTQHFDFHRQQLSGPLAPTD